MKLEPELYNLDNGLTVLLLEDPTAPVVALQIWVSVGSADERPHEAGLAHLHEHMLFRGTERRQVGEIARQVEATGGSINAWTSYDQTVYHIITASRFAEQALDILADAIANSAFDATELERELEVVQEEIKRIADIPGQVLSQAIFATAFSVHPYGRPIIGTAESVASFTREDVLEFFRRWYRPENMTLVVAGDFQTSDMKALVQELFGHLQPLNAEVPQRGTEPTQEETRLSLHFEQVQESQINLAFHTPGLAHQDIPALELLTIILGQGESSILYRELQRNQQLTTDVFAYLYSPREPGLLMAGAAFSAEAEEQAPLPVLDALLTEVFRLRQVTVSLEDLSRAKLMLESETVYQVETVQGKANRLGFFQVVAGDLAFERRFHEMAREVTPEDLRAVARRYLTPENLTVGFMLPGSQEGQLLPVELHQLVRQSFERAEGLHIDSSLNPDQHGLIRHRFPSGLTVLIEANPTVPLVAVRSAYPGGQRFESEENNGFSNFIAELLTSGTDSRNAQEIAEQIESLAGSLQGYAGRNSVGLQMVVLSRHFEQAMALFADCTLHSQFPDSEISRIRRVILSDIQAQEDDLAGSAFRQMNRALFRGHPYQMSILGTQNSIGQLSGQALREAYRNHFRSANMTISVVGDVQPEAVILTIERLFDVETPAEPLSLELPALVSPPLETLVSHRERQQAHLARGFLGASIHSPDRWALETMTTILGAQSGRMFYLMREQQSLAYSVTAFHLSAVDGGYLVAYIATSPDKIEQATESLDRELNRLRDELVSLEELERAQSYLVGQREISLQRNSTRATLLVFGEAHGLGYDDHLQYSERIMAVTPEDIQRVARQYLLLEEGTLSIIRPPSSAVLQSEVSAPIDQARQEEESDN